MSDDQSSQTNITTGNILATSGSLVAVGTNITQTVTFIFNGREYQRPFVNVPAKPTIFVGREELLGEIKAALFKGGNLAVSAFEGKPGVGKTALATMLAWDEEVLAHFSGGTLWANLGPNPDLDTILNRWAEALGVDAAKETDTAGRIAAVQIGLNGRTPLIILDDVWDKRPAHQLRQVGNPGTAYLLTTRDTTIARDFAPKSRFDVAELTEEQAIALLIEFCPAAAADRPALERIARAVGYLPLALTLIGGYMADHITLPGEAAIVLPEVARAERWLGLEDIDRTLTLEQVIALSVDALPEADRPAYAALAAFLPKPTSFTVAAAQEVCDCDASTIGLLIRRNLLEQISDERLTIHQTIAAVANSCAPDLDLAHARHAIHYVKLIDKDRDDWQTIEAEWEQIKHAWQWVSTTTATSELVLPYIAAARIFQNMRGYWRDEIAWIESGIVLARQQGNHEDEATLLNNIATMYNNIGDKQQALNYYEEALPIMRQVSNNSGEAAALNNIGLVYSDLGDKQQALDYYQQALPIRRQVGDRSGEATTLINIGKVHDDLGNKQQALDYFQIALPIMRQVGDRSGEAVSLNNIGGVYSDLGDKDQALNYFQMALDMHEQAGNRAMEAITLNNISTIYYDLGNPQQAIQYLQQSLPIRRLIGDRGGEAITLNNIGKVYNALGDKRQALDYYQQALLIMRQVGNRSGEAITLNNIGMVYATLGDKPQTLQYLERSLPISMQVGDRANEGRVLHNIGHIYLAADDLAQACSHFEQALALGQQVQYPELIQAASAGLEEVRARLAAQGK